MNPFAGVSYSSPALSAFIFSPSSLPCFRSFGPHKSIVDSSVELDPLKVFENCNSILHSSMTISLCDLRGVEGFEPEDKPWDSVLPPSMELDGQGKLLSEEHDSGPTKLLSKEHDDRYTDLDRIRAHIWSMEKQMACGFTDFTELNNDTKMPQVEIRKILGFLLVLLFIYQYLMGYVERGQWNTYSNGAWEFRATYVCIELRLGSYPFQKFRVTPRKYSGVTTRTYDTKNGVIYKYEPWVRFKKDKFYFQGQTTAERAARICDVAKFCLKIKGRKGYNFGEEQYTYLSSVQEFLPQQSDNDIKRLVLEYAKPFLNEVQVSEEVPIVDQPPCVEPARFANGEHIDNTIQEFLPSDSDQVNSMIQELYQPVDADEQTIDMTEEPQSVSANPEFAGPTIEENIREHGEALISSAGPSLIESGCTSQITLIAPCDGTGAVNLFTELKVFRKENWNAKTGAGATSSCALEGCSATMHEFAFLKKSGENQELWPVDIWAKLDAFEDHGWKIELLENGRRAT